MKLEMTLPERPGFLHAVPIFDLFALLLVFFLLGPSFVNRSGVQVELPVSKFQVEQHADAAVITLTGGSSPVIWLERKQVTESELWELLGQRREESAGVPTVYLRTDADTPAGVERKVAEIAVTQGFRTYLLGQSEEVR